jgi:uncharacterized lipoprotein YmbA
MLPRLVAALALTALAACGTTQYFAPPQATSELRLNVATETVAIVDVTIPEYAINQEIPVEQPDGALLTDTDQLWADLPDRALTGALVRHLNVITDAQVAAEPWPLSGFPEAEVSIFVEDMIVGADGRLRFTGTYAVGFESDRRGVIEPFVIFAPVPAPGYPGIMAAHEAAWLQLAERVARDL